PRRATVVPWRAASKDDQMDRFRCAATGIDTQVRLLAQRCAVFYAPAAAPAITGGRGLGRLALRPDARQRRAADAGDAEVAEGRAHAAVHHQRHRQLAPWTGPCAGAAEAEVAERRARNAARREHRMEAEPPAHVERNDGVACCRRLDLGGVLQRLA